MPHQRHRFAQRQVDRAVVQLVAPDLVEADAHVDRRARVQSVQIGRELARRDRVLAHATLEEVAAERGFWKADQLGTLLERRRLRDQGHDPGEIIPIVSLLRLELREGEREEGSHGP